jgi:hypothetical protein
VNTLTQERGEREIRRGENEEREKRRRGRQERRGEEEESERGSKKYAAAQACVVRMCQHNINFTYLSTFKHIANNKHLVITITPKINKSKREA